MCSLGSLRKYIKVITAYVISEFVVHECNYLRVSLGRCPFRYTSYMQTPLDLARAYERESECAQVCTEECVWIEHV